MNGDSHAAAAEAVNSHAWACDDGRYYYLGKAPHPENLEVCWGKKITDRLGWELHNHAQAGCSNERILRTTREYIDKFCTNIANKNNIFLMIQWSTWERQEWYWQGEYYQVGASGRDSVPTDLREKYQQFVIDVDWATCTDIWHEKIWEFHQELVEKQIAHVFFNGDNDFRRIDHEKKKIWGRNYLDPYSREFTYSGWLKQQHYPTVSPANWHFGPDAHCAWAEFMLQYCIDNQLLPKNAICTN